jgi:1,4-alpha-glucan branching enzyme
MDHKNANVASAHRLWAPLLAVVALASAVAGYAYYRAEAERIRQEKYHELAAVAQLKAGQIIEWRIERLADAERLARDPLLIEAQDRFLSVPAAPAFSGRLCRNASDRTNRRFR